MAAFATKEGTRKYFQLHNIHEDKRRNLGDLLISAIGIGTYLGNSDDRTDLLYEKAVVKAAKNGINLFDTAINYRCQRSEKCIATALEELKLNGIERDQLVISTKGGFLTSLDNPENYDHYIRSNYIEKGIITKKDIVANCHCMTPKFLEYEIRQSLENLKIECIDLYYIHNPEIQLMELEEEKFYDKMVEIFSFLEDMVQKGKIKRYGVATWNGFRQKKNTKGLLTLTKLIESAKKASPEGKHHFKAIQLPFNLVMLEAIKVKNQLSEGREDTIFDIAKEGDISIITSAPLMQSQVLNLPARIFEQMPEEASSMLKALQFVISVDQIDAALVGAKSANHIEENIRILQQADWGKSQMEEILKNLGV